jgi:hypothetical protein
MITNRILFGALSCILILQTGCLRNSPENKPGPFVATGLKNIENESGLFEAGGLKAGPVDCEDDPLDFYKAMPVLDDTEAGAKSSKTILAEKLSEDCQKLRKAIKLSIPGSKKQNDEKALSLLNELMQNSVLVGRDLKFSMLLLQHVSQRQQLRKKILLQEKRRLITEQKNAELQSQLETLQSQLDQLKNIEIEIDKKERSVISPISE